MLCTRSMYAKKLHSKSNFNYIIVVIMEIMTAGIFLYSLHKGSAWCFALNVLYWLAEIGLKLGLV